MAKVHSYVMLSDLECEALVLDIFHHLPVAFADDHSPITLAYVESTLVGIRT